MPDWQPIVDTYLVRFATVTSADVDRTEHWATNASMFDATGSSIGAAGRVLLVLN